MLIVTQIGEQKPTISVIFLAIGLVHMSSVCMQVHNSAHLLTGWLLDTLIDKACVEPITW
jgi:hypothetical protein